MYHKDTTWRPSCCLANLYASIYIHKLVVYNVSRCYTYMYVHYNTYVASAWHIVTHVGLTEVQIHPHMAVLRSTVPAYFIFVPAPKCRDTLPTTVQTVGWYVRHLTAYAQFYNPVVACPSEWPLLFNSCQIICAISQILTHKRSMKATTRDTRMSWTKTTSQAQIRQPEKATRNEWSATAKTMDENQTLRQGNEKRLIHDSKNYSPGKNHTARQGDERSSTATSTIARWEWYRQTRQHDTIEEWEQILWGVNQIVIQGN